MSWGQKERGVTGQKKRGGLGAESTALILQFSVENVAADGLRFFHSVENNGRFVTIWAQRPPLKNTKHFKTNFWFK